MALTLVTYPGNFRAFKALIAAEYAGVEIAVKDVDAKAAAKLSPTGKVPVLETPQGTIFESNAIARYVARLRSDADLYGRTGSTSARTSWSCPARSGSTRSSVTCPSTARPTARPKRTSRLL